MPVSEQKPYLVEPAVTIGMKLLRQRLPLGAYGHISRHRNPGSTFNVPVLFFFFSFRGKHTSSQVVERHSKLGHVLQNVVLFSHEGRSGPI